MKKKVKKNSKFDINKCMLSKQNKEKQIVCDNCNEEMHLCEDDFKTYKFKDEKGKLIELKYFECKNCGTKYPYFTINKSVREKMSKLEKLEKNLKKNRENIKTKGDMLKWRKKYKKFLNDKAKLFEEQKKLCSTYEKRLGNLNQ